MSAVEEASRDECPPSLLDLIVSGPVDDRTASVLDLIHGDPLHAPTREAVVQTILEVADEHGGQVSPNVVRGRLPRWVDRRVVGSVYHGLARAGVIRPDGWTTNTDASGNHGKPLRLWRVTGRWSR